MLSRLIPATFCFLLIVNTATARDLIVIFSTAPDLQPGQVVKSEAAIDVPDGTQITLIDETGTKLVISGPYNGFLAVASAAGAAGASGDGKLLASLTNLLAGAGKETNAMGAIRSAGMAKNLVDPRFINVSRTGHHCVPVEGPVTLWRAKRTKNTRLTLLAFSDQSKKSISWVRGAETVKWPADFALADRAKFAARFKDSMKASLMTIHLVPADLPTIAHRVAWMAERGCSDQAKGLFASLK
jgi:hypothetical protein